MEGNYPLVGVQKEINKCTKRGVCFYCKLLFLGLDVHLIHHHP